MFFSADMKWGEKNKQTKTKNKKQKNKVTAIDTPVQKRRCYSLNCVPPSIHMLTVFGDKSFKKRLK